MCFMQEVQDSAADVIEVNGTNMIAALAAAAVLSDSLADDEDADTCSNGPGSFVGCMVEVKFRFTSRSEWVLPGMRFIVRDQSGHISGAGVLSYVHECARVEGT